MDLRAVLADFPGVRPLAGLRDAWYWSRVPLFGLAGALSADGERLLQLSGRGSYDEELAVAVLGFAREREGELFARNAHWGALDGFQPPAGRRDSDFDSVIGISPDVHRAYPVEHPELTPHVRMVFPAYACEFAAAGDETLDEAITENRHGRVWRVEWRDGWLMAEYGEAPREVGVEAAVEFAMAQLYGRAWFDDAAMRMADEVGWFRDYSVEAAHLLLGSAGVTGVPDPIERLDEPLAVRRMCRMAADLQLTKFLHAVITTAVAARTEPRRGAAAIVDVLTTACDLADATGGVVPAQVYRTWRVAHLPGILHPQSGAPEYGRAGFRAYDEELEGLLLGG